MNNSGREKLEWAVIMLSHLVVPLFPFYCVAGKFAPFLRRKS